MKSREDVENHIRQISCEPVMIDLQRRIGELLVDALGRVLQLCDDRPRQAVILAAFAYHAIAIAAMSELAQCGLDHQDSAKINATAQRICRQLDERFGAQQ